MLNRSQGRAEMRSFLTSARPQVISPSTGPPTTGPPYHSSVFMMQHKCRPVYVALILPSEDGARRTERIDAPVAEYKSCTQKKTPTTTTTYMPRPSTVAAVRGGEPRRRKHEKRNKTPLLPYQKPRPVHEAHAPTSAPSPESSRSPSQTR